MSADLVLIIGGRQRVQVGFVFAQCTECGAKFMLWGGVSILIVGGLSLKFQFLVARDHLIDHFLLLFSCCGNCAGGFALWLLRGLQDQRTPLLRSCQERSGKGFVSLMCNRLYYFGR